MSPIFKEVDKTLMSNYRPVSLLTQFSKVFEIVIYNGVQFHIHSYNILAREQYDFRTSISTVLAT